MIERTHLQLIQAVNKKGSVTAAAQTLHLSQSALSHTIKKLENIIGVALWEKHGRRIRLTQAGLYLLRLADRILPQLERADSDLKDFAQGEIGSLAIGMECHPCYQWLLEVVNPFIEQWPNIDVDVKQRFQFGGMAALYNHDIDILVTPDPIVRKGVTFYPVFDYELVLVTSNKNPLSTKTQIEPSDLSGYNLYAYPVEIERLDIYTQFLLPAKCAPKAHKIIEATEIMLSLVQADRGVAALPLWLANDYAKRYAITPQRLGTKGIQKSIHLGVREGDRETIPIRSFLDLAKSTA